MKDDQHNEIEKNTTNLTRPSHKDELTLGERRACEIDVAHDQAVGATIN